MHVDTRPVPDVIFPLNPWKSLARIAEHLPDSPDETWMDRGIVLRAARYLDVLECELAEITRFRKAELDWD